MLLAGVLAAAVTIVGSAGAVGADAVWEFKNRGSASSCDGYWPVAGYLSFVDYHDGSCFVNATLSTFDENLQDDTFDDGAPLSPGWDLVSQKTEEGDYVRIWKASSCRFESTTVYNYFEPAVNYLSFARSGAGC